MAGGNMAKSAELFYDAKALLGEGPFWDPEKELLYWIDIAGKTINSIDVSNRLNKQVKLGQRPGCAALFETEGIILAMENGFYKMNENSNLEFICDPEKAISQNRFNDGKCDAAGRFWAGTMCDDQTEISGALYCIDINMKVHKKLDNIGISNGIAWSPDNKTMYFIDTPTRHIDAFDYNIETGDIKNRHTVIFMPENHGSPDGMSIDEEGMLWVCEWGGAKVSRWNPKTGKLIDEIKVPATYVTSCSFGGKFMNELYITTARIGLGEEEFKNESYAGGVFKVDAGVKGAKSYKFKGNMK